MQIQLELSVRLAKVVHHVNTTKLSVIWAKSFLTAYWLRLSIILYSPPDVLILGMRPGCSLFISLHRMMPLRSTSS